MKYALQHTPIPQAARKGLNEKVLSLIDNGIGPECGITPEDIFYAYTGDGGLHGLERKDYANYHAYSEAKKEIENGQFFTPPEVCEFTTACLRLSDTDLVADLTCGKGSFFNFVPAESNAYGCELDPKAYKVAHYLFPDAHLELGNIRTYAPDVRFDVVLGNPPFNINWWADDGIEKVPSHLYYCQKAAQLLKPLGILALIVPASFLSDSFSDGAQIKEMERHFSFLGQLALPQTAFASLGVGRYATKLQFWQRKTKQIEWTPKPYNTAIAHALSSGFDIQTEAGRVYEQFIRAAKAALETNSFRILLELARQRGDTSCGFSYKVQKLLYHIRVHPRTRPYHPRCCECLYRFYTQVQPPDMPYDVWSRTKLTEAKVLLYLRRALAKQAQRPERDEIALVKQGKQFVYKGYSVKARRRLTGQQKIPVPVYQAVLDEDPAAFPGYERLLRRKRAEYKTQEQPFEEMEESPALAAWLSAFSLYDSEEEEVIRPNEKQRHDINLVLQKRYALLQWEQGSGKTLAGIVCGLYRMQHQNAHSTWVVSSAISIRNNWRLVLANYGLPFVFVERLKDLERIRPGDFVLITLNKISQYQRQISKKIRQLNKNIQLVLDESDEISNEHSTRCKAVLACFRRCRYKLLTTGTSTRNNIVEFAPQLELLYNNSINMISWAPRIYHRSKNSDGLESDRNPWYGKPIPPYKKGYSLFSAAHLPERVTVFGVGKRDQDIYNADTLTDLLGKTVITRTFEEIVGKDIKRLHQVPVQFAPEEREVYQQAIDKFEQMRDGYFASTGNSRKDSMMKLVQQIVLLLRISAAPDTLTEYTGDTPVKVITAVEMAASWPDEIVAIGVRHKTVLQSYAAAIREYLPGRPLFIITGSDSFAKRRALRRTLKESKNGILLCTQQSLPSSVNFEYVNRVILPELHYNNSGMSQFYFRFIRYTSTEYKDIYFLTYAGSIESNLMQMILCKDRLNLFMKGQDVDLDEVYKRFGVDYDLLALMMRREEDKEGKLRIRWGEQMIA